MEDLGTNNLSQADDQLPEHLIHSETSLPLQPHKKTSRKRKIILAFSAFFLLLIGLVSAVILNANKQDLRQQASSGEQPAPPSGFKGNGRFGIAIATWDYSKVQCYLLTGERTDCATAPSQMNRKNFSDMRMTAYDGSNHQLGMNAFNISSFTTLDPSANTQFIWFHYEDTRINQPGEHPQGALEIKSGEFNYIDTSKYTAVRLNRDLSNEEMTSYPNGVGAKIYATSGAPGSVRVKVQKQDGSAVPVDIAGSPPIHKNGFGFRIRLPGIRYDENGYPYCTDGSSDPTSTCIFKQAEFTEYLRQHSDFNDNDPLKVYGSVARAGNWYTFYLLAETEYGIVSHYLEPYEYAAVVNTYVKTIKSVNPRARFILGSPVIGFPDRYKPYYTALWNSPGMLSPQAKESITFIGADHFADKLSNPDVATGAYAAITDAQIQASAEQFMATVRDAGQFFFKLTGKPTLMTQIGPLMHPAVNPEPDSLSFVSINESNKCKWCKRNTDVWQSVQYGTARLTQLMFSKLLEEADTTHVVAWAYWGGMEQEYWKDPLINKTWGGLNHGITWLSWPLLCTTGAGCKSTTNEPWPSYTGMVYLKLANGDKNYIPDGAPSWWPGQQPQPKVTNKSGQGSVKAKILPSPTPTPTVKKAPKATILDLKKTPVKK